MSGEVMKVLIVDDIPETREMLRKLLAFESDIEVVAIAATGREAMDLADELEPDIILMDINMPDMDGIEATEEIKKMHPAVGVIIMSVQSEAQYLRRAMLAGARDFITKPISAESLYETIRRVYDLQEEERAQVSSIVPSGKGELGKKARAGGHIIAVYSPKGGAGVTTIATNMAISLLHSGAGVVLIDGDLQWGDVGVFLNLTSKNNIGDLADSIGEIDQELIESVLVSHASGLKVLLAPHNPEDAERIASTDLCVIIETMTRFFDYVIVDMSKRLDANALSILEIAERIILVATPTLPSIKSVRFVLESFRAQAYTSEKVMFVMNRVNNDARGRASIPLDAIENNLKRTTDARIPLDELTFLSAVNQGVSVITIEPTKSPAVDLIRFTEKVRYSLVGDEVAALAPAVAQGQSRLSGIWSGFSS